MGTDREASILSAFLATRRTELIDLCRKRVAERCALELGHGLPLFIDRLALLLDSNSGAGRLADLPGGAFTVEQVVHDYEDLRWAIIGLASRSGTVLAADDMASLDIGLNRAIASATGELLRGRDVPSQAGARLESLVHGMRNHLNTAILALAAIRSGGVGFGGATAAALERSLVDMRGLMDRTLEEARHSAMSTEAIDLAEFIVDAQIAALTPAMRWGCELTVLPVEPGVLLDGDRPQLGAAIANVLEHAFTCARNANILLSTCASGGRVFIEVRYESEFDRCAQAHVDLAPCRAAVSANGGAFMFRSMPGGSQVATIELPQGGPSLASPGRPQAPHAAGGRDLGNSMVKMQPQPGKSRA